MGDLENLTEMGFDPRRVKLALAKTSSFNDAITWLANNEDKSIEELESASAAPATASSSTAGADEEAVAAAVAEDAVASSLRCKECGKLFKGPALAQFHASKT